MDETPQQKETQEKIEVQVLSHEGKNAGELFSRFVEVLQKKYPDSNLQVEKIPSDKAYEVKISDETVGVLVGFIHGGGFLGQRIIVDPAFRERGIGKRLIDSAKKDFKDIRLFPQPFKGTAPEDHDRQKKELVQWYEAQDFHTINEAGAMQWKRPGPEPNTPI